MKENIDFKLYATNNHFVAEFPVPPAFDKKDMPTTNREPLRVGERITKMHDKCTSAAFVALDLIEGWEFEYIGMLDVELFDGTEYKNNTLVFFDVYHDGVKANTPIQGKTLFDAGDEKYAYPAYILKEFDDKKSGYEVLLFFHTAGNSGRITCPKTIIKSEDRRQEGDKLPHS